MARKAQPVGNDDRSKLIAALRFASIATKDNEGKTAFVSIHENLMTAENDTYSLGIKVDVGLELCPQADLFAAALLQCSEQFQLTQVSATAVSIKSGNFRVLIPALSSSDTIECVPDPQCAAIDDRIREAFASCIRVMSKTGERVYHNALLLKSATAVATNGGVAVEHFHGIDLPGPLNIPRRTVDTIVKIGKPLAGFGFSATSVTFYFDDSSFLKTRLIAGDFPNIDTLFDRVTAEPLQIWPQFYAGLDAINAFSNNDTVVFHADYVATHENLDMGASYRVPGIPTGYAFSAAYWKAIEPMATHVYIGSSKEPFAFVGKNVRGLIIGKSL